MWSMGVIMFIMLSGKPPFGGKTNKEIINNVLNGTVAPFAIPVTNTVANTVDMSQVYIPIKIDFDYQSLNPSNLFDVSLASGTLHIPTTIPGATSGSSVTYMGFGSSSLDSNVTIEIVAQPIGTVISPTTSNSIIQLAATLQNTTTIDDVVIQLSSL